MESLAALGLASNAIQFVDFTSKLISTAHSLYISTTGTTAENAELEVVTKHIRALADNTYPQTVAVPGSNTAINSQSSPASAPDALQDLARQCREVADELLTLLASFGVQGRHRTWKSIRSALRTVRHKAQMGALLARLDRIGSQLRTHLLMHSQVDIMARLDALQAENHRLGAARGEDLRTLKDGIYSIFTQLDRRRREDRVVRNEIMILLPPKAGLLLQFTQEQRILETLRFEGMDDRHVAIHPAHERTFSWVFGGTRDSPSIDFADWLRADDCIYWVSGKPGSGKSTLMKYLCNHHLLNENLNIWAGTHTLVIAKFFFWDLGKDDLQKSQIGLLRSLLYQILHRYPDLMQHAFPSHNCRTDADEGASNDVALSVEGLLSAFQRIKGGLAASQFRYCFMIDGLDEYQGKPTDIIRLIEILKDSPHVKICLSSRPWNEFENAFGRPGSRRIYMERLTRNDIERYVRDTFERDASFRELRADDDGVCTEIVEEIAESAKGVFLWVRLVVQSLLEGITNADRMLDLRRRLHSLPTDLEEYFKRIVFTVDPFYRQQTAHFFRVTICAHATLPLLLYWFMDQEDPVQYALELEICPLSMQAANRHLTQIRKRLNACCKGLLEIQFYDTSDLAESSLASSVLFNWKVDFLHRTARDFLQTETMRNQLDEWTLAGCSAHDSICAAILAQVKCTPQEEEYFVLDGPVEKLRDIFGHHLKSQSVSGSKTLSSALKTVMAQQWGHCDLDENKTDEGDPLYVSSMGRGFLKRLSRFW